MTEAYERFVAERVIVMAAPNGARRTQQDHPALPVTAAELADTAVALRDAGVSLLHLHVRDDSGGHTLDPDRYREAIAAIRERVGEDLILQVTTEAVGMYTPDEQVAVVRDLQPEAVSLALREICPDDSHEADAARFFEWMRDAGVWPQLILYSREDVRRFDDMRRRGVFADPAPFVLFVLGSYADARAGRIADLEVMLGAADSSAFPWAVCCFGPEENAVMLAAAAQGGHVRIGFENNLMLADGSAAADNAALVREFAAGLTGQPRSPAAAGEVRSQFGLS